MVSGREKDGAFGMNRGDWLRFWCGIGAIVFLLISAFSRVSFGEEGNAAKEKKAWVVVTREMFKETLGPLAEKRREDGYSVKISTKPVAETISSLGVRPDFLVLVGDNEKGKEGEEWFVPSKTCELYRWRAEQEKGFVSDSLFGDLDGDLVCDVPVGRLPVRTREQLKTLVEKILAYEDGEPSPRNLCVPVYAGSSGYGAFYDSMTTQLLLGTLEKNAAGWLRPWMISADPTHPLCGWPAEQARVFTERLKDGGLMTVLMGHGSTNYFYAMEFENKHFVYTAKQAAAGLATVSNPGPVTVVFACHTGNFAASIDCLAESLLFLRGGPVATIGATTESHPMTNYFSGLCLLRQTKAAHRNIGGLWLNAQKDAMKARDFVMEKMLRDIEGKLEENINTKKLRRDQMLMYALLGDPATTMPFPKALECQIRAEGNVWKWSAKKPKGASKLYVEFRADGLKFPEVQLPLKKGSAMVNLEKANEVFAFRSIAELSAGEAWEGKIEKAGTLRLTAIGGKRIYVGSHKTTAGLVGG